MPETSYIRRRIEAIVHRRFTGILTIGTILLLIANSRLSAQSPLCTAVQDAQRTNTIVRVTLQQDSAVTGRFFHTGCPGILVIGRSRFDSSRVEALEIRMSRADSYWNGIGIGALAGGLLFGTYVVFGSGGDARFRTGFVYGGVAGGLLGFAFDAAREAPAEWVPKYRR